MKYSGPVVLYALLCAAEINVQLVAAEDSGNAYVDSDHVKLAEFKERQEANCLEVARRGQCSGSAIALMCPQTCAAVQEQTPKCPM